jgi:hypothetical protein
VRYKLQAPDEDYGHYTRAGGMWAQVDEEHLAECLLAAAEIVEQGDKSLGDAARRRIAERLSPIAVGKRMQESLTRLLSGA